MTFVIPYPVIDPILFEIGPFALRWYALAYIAGLMLGWRYVRRLIVEPPKIGTPVDVDDFLMWATFGVVIGGRLGYVLFYRPDYYFNDPLAILRVWQGGMSFHGGILGVTVALIAFAKRRGLQVVAFGDLAAAAAPIGLFFGRIANFINGELFGRVTDVPWAMVFPRGGPEPRHPSQLYEASLEGALLFLVLWWMVRRGEARRRPGLAVGTFLVGYALCRMFAELFREPDMDLGFLIAGTTIGQWLSFPMLVIGIIFLVLALRRPRV
ncbi:MAG: prolipoprotein diacylglyceryl transferase [Rhodospirillales bacterium]|nr:prolipoprotein diacylglyceryl transferase [Rhodospirillales bacterium]